MVAGSIDFLKSRVYHVVGACPSEDEFVNVCLQNWITEMTFELGGSYFEVTLNSHWVQPPKHTTPIVEGAQNEGRRVILLAILIPVIICVCLVVIAVFIALICKVCGVVLFLEEF